MVACGSVVVACSVCNRRGEGGGSDVDDVKGLKNQFCGFLSVVMVVVGVL